MSDVAMVLERLANQPVYMREKDRLDESGLICCGICGGRRQKRQELLGNLRTVRIPCSCERQSYQAEQRKRKEREAQDRIAAMRTACIHDRRLLDHTFANDDGSLKQLQSARNYVASWEEQKRNNTGLLLWGGVGTGKTFYAACIANALLDRGVSVMMTSFPRILNSLGSLHSDDRNRFVADLMRYELLILDDLGTERSTGYAMEQLCYVIDERYKSRRPLIVTTNLSLDTLKNPPDLDWQRIGDRIREMCVPVCFPGPSRRAAAAADKKHRAAGLFSSSQQG